MNHTLAVVVLVTGWIGSVGCDATAEDVKLPRKQLETPPAKPIPNRANIIEAIGHSSNAKEIYTSRRDGTVEIWNRRTGARLASIQTREEGTDGPVETLFSPDGQWAAVWCLDQASLTLWNMRERKKEALLPRGEPKQTISNMAFSPDGRHFAACGMHAKPLPASSPLDRPRYEETGLLRVWEISKRDVVKSLVADDACGGGWVSFSGDNKWVLMSGGGRQERGPGFRVWDVATGREIASEGVNEGFSGSATFLSPTNHVLYIPSAPGFAAESGQPARLFDVTKRRAVQIWPERNHEVERVITAANGSCVLLLKKTQNASGEVWRTLTIRDIATGRDIRNIALPRENVCATSLSPDGKEVLAFLGDSNLGGRVVVWSVETGKETARLADNRSPVEPGNKAVEN